MRKQWCHVARSPLSSGQKDLAVRMSKWQEERKLTHRECSRLAGIPHTTWESVVRGATAEWAGMDWQGDAPSVAGPEAVIQIEQLIKAPAPRSRPSILAPDQDAKIEAVKAEILNELRAGLKTLEEKLVTLIQDGLANGIENLKGGSPNEAQIEAVAERVLKEQISSAMMEVKRDINAGIANGIGQRVKDLSQGVNGQRLLGAAIKGELNRLMLALGEKPDVVKASEARMQYAAETEGH